MRPAQFRTVLCGALILLAGRALGQMPSVGMNVAADVAAIEAGKPFRVAITVTPETGWHIYWKNPGDAGLPTKVKWTLPAGFKAGELQFPIPQRFVTAGNIISYGYDEPTTFLATITPPKDVKVGDTVTLKGTVSWLCCKEECVPGKKAFEVSLPVSERASPANEAGFKEAQSKMPLDTPPAGIDQLKVEATRTADGEAFTLKASEPGLKLEMFPQNVDGLSISDIASSGDSQIDFKVRVMEGQKLAVQELPVLIVYTHAAEDHAAGGYGSGTREGFYTKIDVSGLSASDGH